MSLIFKELSPEILSLLLGQFLNWRDSSFYNSDGRTQSMKSFGSLWFPPFCLSCLPLTSLPLAAHIWACDLCFDYVVHWPLYLGLFFFQSCEPIMIKRRRRIRKKRSSRVTCRDIPMRCLRKWSRQRCAVGEPKAKARPLKLLPLAFSLLFTPNSVSLS